MSMAGPGAVGVDVLPGPESRGGEYRDEPPVIPVFVGGGELSRRAFRPGLVGADGSEPWVDDNECIGGSVKGGPVLVGPDGAYRVGDRIGPVNANDDDGLRGTGGLLRGGERPKGEPRLGGSGKDDGVTREACSSGHGNRGECIVAPDCPFDCPDVPAEDMA